MNARNATLAVIAALSLAGLGCNRERNEQYGRRNYDQNTAQRTNQSGHDNADQNRVNDKYANLADRDATGGGHRYTVSKIDSKTDTITLTPVQAEPSQQSEKQLQAGTDVTVSFDDFDRFVGPTQSTHAKDLKEGQRVAVFRDASGNVSKIIVPKDPNAQQQSAQPSQSPSDQPEREQVPR